MSPFSLVNKYSKYGANARFYPYTPELNFELLNSLRCGGDNFGICVSEVMRYMNRYLRSMLVAIFGEDGNSPVQHPVYWVGLAEDGAIVGVRSVVIWT